MERIKSVILKILKTTENPGMRILPGNLAFFLVLSTIPIITLIGYIASLFSISVDTMVKIMNESLPGEVSNILIPFVSGRGFDINIVMFMIIGFILASNGPHSIIVTSNTLYNIDNSYYLKRRIKALFLTIILVLLFIFILIVLAFGNMIMSVIINSGFFHPFNQEITFIYLLLKWPIAFICILFSIKLVYTIAPDFNILSKNVTKGALFTTISWILATAVYSYYVNHIANYDLFYGSVSNIIIMMMWIYFLAYLLVLGIAINASNYNMEKSTINNN